MASKRTIITGLLDTQAGMKDFKDKVAVITGGANGIGRGIARALVAKGAKVVLADIQEEPLAQTVKELQDAGHDVRGYKCDVTDAQDLESLADNAWDDFGRVDLLFNNAGVGGGPTTLTETDAGTMRWIFEVNFFAIYQSCQIFVPRLIAQKTPSRIINTGSENSVACVGPLLSAYNASKHAVLGMSDVLREELPEHVSVSVLCPGFTKTEIASSGKLRHDRYGGALEPRAGGGGGTDPDDTAQLVLSGIEKESFYIFTHYPTRISVDDRLAEMKDAMDDQLEPYEGWEAHEVRRMLRGYYSMLQDKGS